MSVTRSVRAEILDSAKYCWYCGDSWPSTIDHVISIHRGGTDLKENLVACCKSCNSRKKNKSLEEFRVQSSWRETKYSGIISYLQAENLIKLGINFEGFPSSYEFHGEKYTASKNTNISKGSCALEELSYQMD